MLLSKSRINGKPLTIEVDQVSNADDKYGRMLADVYFHIDGARVNIKDHLILIGYGVPYSSGANIKDWHLKVLPVYESYEDALLDALL